MLSQARDEIKVGLVELIHPSDLRRHRTACLPAISSRDVGHDLRQRRVLPASAADSLTTAAHIAGFTLDHNRVRRAGNFYAYEALLTKLKLARKQYAAGVRSGKYRSSYTAETAADHFALAWVGQVYGKLLTLVPQGDDEHNATSDGRELVAVQSQDKALIAEYLSNITIAKSRKSPEIEMDLNAQIAGMLAGRDVDLHAGIARGGDESLALAAKTSALHSTEAA